MKAQIILENGQVFIGESIKEFDDVVCELVFNTSMVGYSEILTDPSYAGQGIVMTYPLIGNYGIASEDMESNKIWASCFIVKELSDTASNFRSAGDIQGFLNSNNIPAVFGIDTRMLTKVLRENGTMMGVVTNKQYTKEESKKIIDSYKCPNLVEMVSCKEKETYGSGSKKIALLDFGGKQNIIKSLVKRDCEVTVFPCNTKAEDILNSKFDGIVLSNGPGDPKDCKEAIKNIKKIYDANIPVFGICLGHQLMALATGLNTQKLKYGHRGANHPVKDLSTGRIHITSQNHSYVVDEESIDKQLAKPLHININDNTIEGLEYIGKNIFTVQFHPEACPGPADTNYLFDKFLNSL